MYAENFKEKKQIAKTTFYAPTAINQGCQAFKNSPEIKIF